MLRTLWGLAIKTTYERVVYSPRRTTDIVAAFHRLYYDSFLIGGTWRDTRWLGVPIQKCPLDMWIYQELIFRVTP